MHGNEVVGREMLLLMLQLLCDNYGKNAFLTSFVDNTRIHIMPSMNPDGYEIAQEGRQRCWLLYKICTLITLAMNSATASYYLTVEDAMSSNISIMYGISRVWLSPDCDSSWLQVCLKGSLRHHRLFTKSFCPHV